MKYLCSAVAMVSIVTGCVASENLTSNQLSARVSAVSTSVLCAAVFDSRTSPRGLLMIEAELAVRQIVTCPMGNYGKSSTASIGQNLYPRSQSEQGPDLYNCNDFKSDAEAQKFFLAQGGPINDPNVLDADGDGLACEWGVTARSRATFRAPRVVAPTISRPRLTTQSRCYTGPRGGTYTITASGSKNYNGC